MLNDKPRTALSRASAALERNTDNTMARLPRGKTKHAASHSAAMKAKRRDPDYRAKMAALESERAPLLTAYHDRITRTVLPKGRRK